ncbi:MAG: hypothetical protein AB7V58_03160 [Solirubrobacterales bacterium]
MLFEFQLRDDAGEWVTIGTSGTPGDRFDVEEAAVALRDMKGGHLPSGHYRVRAAELPEPEWMPAEVDDHGVFRRLER